MYVVCMYVRMYLCMYHVKWPAQPFPFLPPAQARRSTGQPICRPETPVHEIPKLRTYYVCTAPYTFAQAIDLSRRSSWREGGSFSAPHQIGSEPFFGVFTCMLTRQTFKSSPSVGHLGAFSVSLILLYFLSVVREVVNPSYPVSGGK
jgi:hypothetical protein